MDDQQLGQLMERVAAIKENTDKIPAALTTLAIHDLQLKSLVPMVKQHEKMSQRAMMLATLISTAIVIATEVFRR